MTTINFKELFFLRFQYASINQLNKKSKHEYAKI
jgi:hypothetical protein